MWWNESYINRRNWIFQHFKDLDLTLSQGMLLLTMDYMQEFNQPIDLNTLSQRLNIKSNEVDELLSQCMAKGYIQVNTSNKQVTFELEGLFSTYSQKPVFVSTQIFEIFEEEFGRPLSQKETEQLSQWSRQFADKIILKALKEASVLRKYNMNYIERILFNHKDQKTTNEPLKLDL